MKIDAVAVAFNHDPSSDSNDALNLRRNGSRGTIVLSPEWRAGQTNVPTASPVAYSLDATRGEAIAIEAQFVSDRPGAAVQIRALDPAVAGQPAAGEGPPACSAAAAVAYYQGLLGYQMLPWLAQTRAGVLGDVPAQRVTFRADGTSETASFDLAHVRLGERGVSVSDVHWRWQFRASEGSPWRDFAWTTHRVYAVLQAGVEPWSQLPFNDTNTQLPWTDLLDFACTWASGATTPDRTAERVTAAVFSLGPGIVTYDCLGGGSSHYTRLVPVPAVDCTALLDRLRGGIGNGELVNCTDCASIVSTLSNAIGCELWESGMFSDLGIPFAVNPIFSIGASSWQTACGWGAFSYHEVAWKGACTARDRLFDACLLINGGQDPTRAPFFPLLPANVEFGEPGQGFYRDRLASPTGRAFCAPQPQAMRQRRVAV